MRRRYVFVLGNRISGQILLVLFFIFLYSTEVVAEHVEVWDTGKQYKGRIAPDEIKKKEGWKKITNDEITGDVCIMNKNLALIIGKASSGAQVFYIEGNTIAKGAVLVPVGMKNDKGKSIISFKITENSENRVFINTSTLTQSGENISLDYTLETEHPFVEVKKGKGIEKVLVQMQAEHTILPDLFSNDLVFNADEINASKIYPPTEHYLLHLIDNGNAIVMCVWPSDKQEINIDVGQVEGKRSFTGTEINYNGGEKVWVAILAKPGIWHRVDSNLSSLEDTRLSWRVPFPGHWYADIKRERGMFASEDGLIDTWPFVIKNDGEYVRPEHHTIGIYITNMSTRGTFISGLPTNLIYPAYIDDNNAFLRIPKFGPGTARERRIAYNNPYPIIIYPLEKVLKEVSTSTSADINTPMDIIRKTLGLKLAESLWTKIHINVDWNKMTTCDATAEIEKIFLREEEVKERKRIEDLIAKMDSFVKQVASRINEYLDWSKKMQDFYKNQRKTKPSLGTVIDEMEKITMEIDSLFAERKEMLKTPQYEKSLSERYMPLIDSNAEDKEEKCKELGREIRKIGWAGDDNLGKFRVIAKSLRQKSGVMMSTSRDKEVRNFLREVREKTYEILQSRFEHEGK